MGTHVKTASIALVLGTLLSFPLIFYLELKNVGAITLLIFLLTGLVAIFLSLFRRNRKEL
jgi:hypothetical protein